MTDAVNVILRSLATKNPIPSEILRLRCTSAQNDA
jgi:hypothetical protein